MNPTPPVRIQTYVYVLMHPTNCSIWGGEKIASVWESSETDPAKAWDFDDNNSWIKKFFWSISKRGTQWKMIAPSNFYFTWRWGIGHDPPPPRVNVENLSAVRRINSTISTRSNIDPRGEGGRRAPENCHIYAFLVLHEVRKCVELFYRNWPGLTLSSPIRFSSADRRMKSIS